MKKLLLVIPILLILVACAPTLADLNAFLEEDKTDEIPYTDEFECHAFAVTLFENAEAEGLEVGFVSVHFGDYDFHALNVFKTNEGLVFVDNSFGHDAFVILEVGNPYIYQYTANGTSYAGIGLGGKPIVEYRIIWDLEEWGDIWD